MENNNHRCAMSLTGDPPTIGHRDIAKRAWQMFGHIVVFIPEQSFKSSSLLDYEERKTAIERDFELDGIKDFEVKPIKKGQALVDAARDANCSIVIRGLRNGQDLIYETDMAAVNRMLEPAIETVYLPCKSELSFVSSSSVRELVKLGKWETAENFTSVQTLRTIKRKVTHVVALTGGIACGKSTAREVFRDRGWNVLDADNINRNEVLGNYAKIRDVADALAPWGNVDVSSPENAAKSIAPIIFNNEDARTKLENIAFPTILRYINKAISDWRICPSKKILVEVPLLFENRASSFNDFFDSSLCIWSKRHVAELRLIRDRGMTRKDAIKRLDSQIDSHFKAMLCDYSIENIENQEKSIADNIAAFKSHVNDVIDEIEKKL